jgi:hypothetical protein
MHKKIVSLIVASNEYQWWLKDVIDGLWEFSDKIVVVDGSPFGPSVDGTIEYLKMLDSEKVAYGSSTFNTLCEQKNAAMKIGLDFNPDYFLTCDADEIMHPDDLKTLRSYIDVENAPPVVMFKMYHTWKDFQHHQIGGPFSNPFIRLFKNVDGIHYDPPPAGDEPKDKEGRYLKIHDHYVLKTKFLPEPLTLHVGHSKDIGSECLKVMRYAKWESAPIEQFLWRISKNTWFDDRNPEPELPQKTMDKFRDFEDPCAGCPKNRNLISYCFNECPFGKTIQREQFSYSEINKDNIGKYLEDYGIKQNARL